MTPELESLAQQLIEAGEKADWMQVALNCSYGPPCFHFEADRGKFCLRAKTWFGHDGDPHNYVSLGDLIRGLQEELKQARRDALSDAIGAIQRAAMHRSVQLHYKCATDAIRALMEKP